MTLKYSKSAQKQSSAFNLVSIEIFIGSAKDRQVASDELLWLLPTCFALLAYLGYFSVLKFRRVKLEAGQFELLEKSY